MREWIVAGYKANESLGRFIRNFLAGLSSPGLRGRIGVLFALSFGASAEASEPRLIIYPDADLPQARRAFENFRESVHAAKLDELFNVKLEYLPVDVTNIASLEAKLKSAIERNPTAIIGTSGTTAQKAKSLTSTIPIIFATQTDPVRMGLVESAAKPGGNLTGISFHQPIDDKRLQLLSEAFPSVRRVAVLADRYWLMEESAGESAAYRVSGKTRLGLALQVFEVNHPDELVALLDRKEAQGVDAWYVPHTFLAARYGKVVVDALSKSRKPVIYSRTNMVERGGLLAYQQDIKKPTDVWAGMLKMILSGVKPGDIPVERPKDFEFAVNITAAKAMGLALPKSILRRADITF